MKIFYKKLIQTFELPENQALFTAQNIAPVQYIDIYAGQDQFEENFELFARPALLVDWDIEHGYKTATATLNFYCCYEQLRDTSNISLNQELGLKFLDYIEIINTIISGIETEETGKLDLVTEGFNKMDSIVDIYLFTYKCSFTERQNPLQQYEEGNYDTLDLTKNIVEITFD
jgi:hypothetical protein